jgi:MFS family permease
MVFPELKTHFGVTEFELGVLVALQLLVSLLSSFVSVTFDERFGRRATSNLGLFLYFLGVLFFSFSKTYVIALFSLAIVGLGQGIFVPTFYSGLGDAFPERRGIVLGVANSIFMVGGFLGPWMVAIITALYTWSTPFLLLAVGGLVGVSVDYSLSKPSLRDMTFNKTQSINLIKSRSIRILITSSFIAGFGMGAFTTWTPTFLRTIRSLEIGVAALAFGSATVAAMVGCIVAGVLADYFEQRLVVFCFGIAAGLLSTFLYTAPADAFRLTFLSTFFGFFSYPYWNLLMTLAQAVVDRGDVTAATALVRAAAVAGGAVSSLVSGVLISYLGLFLTLACLVPFSFFLYSFLALRLSKPG